MAADALSACVDYDRTSLRWLADTYERVQAIRLDAGERIRAVAQGRTSAGAASPMPADTLLTQIRTGALPGPVPVLGDTYRVHWTEEQRLRRAMATALESHPAWSWLSQVRGVGPTLAAKLLARLDIERAPRPSSFWSYCGLATVPAVEYRCALCGLRRVLPDGMRPPANHARSGGSVHCAGAFVRDPTAGLRVAPRRGVAGTRPAYDAAARRACFQVGVCLLRARGAYADFYRKQRSGLETSERGWSSGHCHMAALRKTEKLFLSHLWLMWAEAAGLAQCRPYACDILGRPGFINPRSMTDRR